MTMNLIKKIGIVLCLLLASAPLFGCGSVSGKRFDRYGYFGTLTVFAVYADFSSEAETERVGKAIAECEAALAEIDGAVGSGAESDVSRFNAANRGETLGISRTTYELLGIAAEMYELTDGAYNPAVGNLVDLWGFSPRFDGDYTPTEPYDRDVQSVPDEEYIEAFRTSELLDFGAVKLSEADGKYFITKPDACVSIGGKEYTVNLNLGGIGKGYAADKCAEILSKHGVTESYVGVGQSSLRLLNGNNGDWKVALNHPRGSGKYLTVLASNVAASTSGDYERFFIENGARYCHVIDPSTGRPTTGAAAVSLFGGTAAEGDALTTALMCMSEEKTEKFVNEKLSDKKVFIYNSETKELLTNADANDYALGDDGIKVRDIRTVDRKRG